VRLDDGEAAAEPEVQRSHAPGPPLTRHAERQTSRRFDGADAGSQQRLSGHREDQLTAHSSGPELQRDMQT
jgi:hypothetical protein